MIYSQYGIELVRLESDRIEMLRQWRNDSSIARNMEFQQHISPSMQSKWFATINNCQNFYFLIRGAKEWMGMIHLSDIDYSSERADAGMFISHQSYLNTSYPVRASFALLHFAFGDLGLKKIRIKVKRDNTKALHYNQQLGFVLETDRANSDFLFLQLSPPVFQSKTERLRKALESTYATTKTIHFDRNLATDQEIKNRFFS